MSERFGPERLTPSQTIEFTGASIIVDWFTCRLRTFNDEALNHVEVYEADGTIRRIRVPQEVMDDMFEAQFPYSFDPVPDSAIEEWFADSLTVGLDMDEELRRLQEGP